jgi:hypothetical protein
MSTTQHYRERAIECAAAAELVRDPRERATLLAIAKAFMNMARHVRESRTALCPRCSQDMKLVHVVAELGGLPGLLVFTCAPCGEMQTWEARAGARR